MANENKSTDTISLILEILPAAMNTIATLTEFVNKSGQTLQQSAELTPEQETARDQIIAAAQKQPYWQQD